MSWESIIFLAIAAAAIWYYYRTEKIIQILAVSNHLLRKELLEIKNGKKLDTRFGPEEEKL